LEDFRRRPNFSMSVLGPLGRGEGRGVAMALEILICADGGEMGLGILLGAKIVHIKIQVLADA